MLEFTFLGIPAVIVVKGSNGEIITRDGKNKIEELGSSAFAQWEWDHACDDEKVEREPSKEPSKEPSAPPPDSIPTIDESMYKSALEQPSEAADHANSDRISIADSLTSENNMFDREDFYGDDGVEGNNSGPQWTWLTNGSCKLDPSHLPASWFLENISSQSSLSNEAWRMNILEVREFTSDQNSYCRQSC